MKPFFFLFFLFFSADLLAQRSYKPHSVLRTGTWAKISVAETGVYKMDGAFLAALGFGSGVPSAQLRVFGNGGEQLPEANSAARPDDLNEISILIVDGGDGTISGADYVLFYASGPHQWIWDSVGKQFFHKKNIYSDKSYYYLTVGGAGLRISSSNNNVATGTVVTTFDEMWYHELDSINFLSSGKEWFGEEFSLNPGHTPVHTFNLPFTDLVPGQGATIKTNVVSRSVGSASTFLVKGNNSVVQQITVPPVGGTPLDLFAQGMTQTNSFTNNEKTLALSFNYSPASFNAQGWLNWFEIFVRRNLNLPATGQLLFRDAANLGKDAVTYSINNAALSTQIWDVTNPEVPVKMNTLLNGNAISFTNEATSLHQYISFTNSYLYPQLVGKVANQDLHNATEADYIIVTHPLFLAQAIRLATFHQQRSGLKTMVVTTEQIFNEFASGIADPTAIRDFVKMYYDKYNNTWKNRGKYLALFGKASFDYKDRLKYNTNYVPAYETAASLDPLATYTSDDFFGFLDSNEDINSGSIINDLDIGIGRLPVKTAEEATSFVDKVVAYHSSPSFGPWRNNLNFVADDEDNNLHLQDAETVSATTTTTAPLFNAYKFYLDAYKQEGGSAGGRYPQANIAITNALNNGTLIWNYSGHGGPARLAEEVVLDQQTVGNLKNENRLPLFITATCDFAPFDNPTVNSLGEDLIVRPKTGAIALMTTTRVVFAFSNRIMNDNYLRLALQQDSAGNYKTLGEAVQAAKNFTYQNFGDVANNRKFALLGDPAMRLGFPKWKVLPTLINGHNIGTNIDTLKAAEMVLLEGVVTDNRGAIITDFNGTVYLSLFDKPQTAMTLGNDPTSLPVPFTTQSSVLFKGKATASSGRFLFNFKLPKDINYQYGKGKISLYAHNKKEEGSGYSNNIIIGGIDSSLSADREGPTIKAYLNNEQFVSGNITDNNPILIVKLIDSSGINTGGTGIGHDLVATLDNDNRSYFVLNSFYESDLDHYQKGSLRFQLPLLAAGPHTLKIKAWDVVNNSSEYTLDFIVNNTEELTISHVLNYPNPFTTKTAFWFEHNQPATDLNVRVEIFTVGGKLVKTMQQTINNSGNRSSDLEWDGKDEWGEKMGKGIYIYRLQVAAPNGKKASQLQKLLLFR